MTLVRSGVWGSRRRLCDVALLVALVVLVPLAYASPPDSVRIAGIYDGGDLDDVVFTVTSFESPGVERFVPWNDVSRVARVTSFATSRLPDVSPRRADARAPPNA